MNNRIERVLARLKEMNLEQILITDPMSIYYLTGVYVQPMERFFGLYLNQEGKAVLFLNKLFVIPEGVQIEQEWFTDTDDVTPILARHIDASRPLGVDKDLKARILIPLMDCKAATAFANASLAVDLTRGIKNKEEQEKMREASRINDLAMERFVKLFHDGVTEIEVAEQFLGIYQELGAESYSFTPIVSFGKNAADPHHHPDETVLKEGDCIIVDVGCVKDGYCSDMTRTFFYKKVSDFDAKIYNIVRAANEAAEEKVMPGTPLSDLDKAARDLISEEGYGPYFTHRLGHFIGLSEHEYGDVSSASDWDAQEGMVFSVEPGIYLADKNVGVRVEDLVLVTEDGVERLNHFTKELLVIG